MTHYWGRTRALAVNSDPKQVTGTCTSGGERYTGGRRARRWSRAKVKRAMSGRVAPGRSCSGPTVIKWVSVVVATTTIATARFSMTMEGVDGFRVSLKPGYLGFHWACGNMGIVQGVSIASGVAIVDYLGVPPATESGRHSWICPNREVCHALLVGVRRRTLK